MRVRSVRLLLALPALAVGLLPLAGCGEKIPLPTGIKNDDGGRLLDTVYIAVLPHWTEAGGIPFVRPRGVAVGYDRTIYVCDSVNNRIARLDAEGSFLESYSAPGPLAVTQDRGLNLLCVNNTRTVWARRFLDHDGFGPLVAADSIFSCDTVPNGAVFCSWIIPRLLGVAAAPDASGRCYVTDDVTGRIYRFAFFLPKLTFVFPYGFGIGEVYSATGLATLPTSDGGYRLIVTQYPGYHGVEYFNALTRLPAIPDDAADIYHRTLDDYKTVAADRVGNVYVLHRQAAQVMVFDKRGRFVLAFGRPGSDLLGLSSPSGIAVLDETILIADTGNNRIVRYQMTAVPEN